MWGQSGFADWCPTGYGPLFTSAFSRKEGVFVVNGSSPLRFYKRSGNVPVEVTGERMADRRIDLPQGTLDLLILRTLALEALHGWAISERIHQISSKVLLVQQGSLYPALHRLEREGWIKARWGASENNRRAKFYELTSQGRKQLELEESTW